MALTQMHVAVAHEREVGVDAFRREGLGERFIDGQVFHWGAQGKKSQLVQESFSV
jgi:hypothetical protein